MKNGNQINVTLKDDNMLLFKGIVGQIEFEDDNFLKFTYITKRGGISSMLVDKRFHNVEVIKKQVMLDREESKRRLEEASVVIVINFPRH